MRRATAALAVAAIVVSPNAVSAADIYKIGEKAPSGDLVFLVHGYVDPATTTNQFAQPDPGNRYVAVDVEVINKKARPQRFSKFDNLLTLSTKDRRSYEWALFDALEPGPPDGEIPPKFGLRGWVTYEIPSDAKLGYLRAQGSRNANGALIRLKQPA